MQKHSKRHDLQGLRFLAIFAVLLFHIWPDLFPNGYLGVDIFFVLSGFLMCTILSSGEFNSASIDKFYFRRIKRIFPTYYFIIVSTLLAGFVILLDSFYPTMISESTSAALFASNMFNLPASGYFAVNNQYPLFLHTWSLSVEVQFYLIVPWIFWLLTRFRERSKPVGWLILLAICVFSFGFQVYFLENTNISHMSMASRMWQFMVGFATAFSTIKKKEAEASDYILLSEDAEENQKTKTFLPEVSTCTRLAKIVVTATLTVLLLSKVMQNAVVLRAVSTLLAGLFIYLNDDTILSHPFMVYIGDVSYSIYLVHWPIAKLSKYYNTGKTVSQFDSGICIIAFSLMCGCLVEHLFMKISSYITKWSRLILLLTLFLSAIFSLQMYIQFSVPTEDVPKDEVGAQNRTRLLRYNETGFLEYAKGIYQNRQNPLNMTRKEIEFFNLQQRDYLDNNAKECKKRQWGQFKKVLKDSGFYDYVCQVEGSGNKEVLIIGDSVARDTYMGVQENFRDVYSHMSLVSRRGFHPFYRDPGLSNDSDVIFSAVVKNWERPIDILFVLYSTTTFGTEEVKKKYVDKYPMMLQVFLDQVQPYVKDLIFLGYPEVTVDTFNNIEEMFKFIRDGSSLDAFHMSWPQHKKRKARFSHVTENIQCPKCLKVDHARSMCSTITDRCLSALPNGLILRRDNIHAMLMGSFFYAEEFRFAYDRKYGMRQETRT
ncbi:unnamed protein product [Bursaphelenchus xylophilus]|uniref:(pine wood nematode) hypothetical protein n=1 Tax=Bursaphelenchus xylophilus TaxID=6326 RepID=A0A1I7S6T5_BURXY|nr:unnamed protein product [Bursaphelenchus xylophilus]CAG9079793.1 unnamed protein product [Bursaphelenchus xylophilus]